MRVIVEPHGGHFWSSQGQTRPLDVVSLRIDNAERMANSLPDFYVSPTRYMLAYLQQRGWQLPSNSEIIPNVVPTSKRSETVSTCWMHIFSCTGRIMSSAATVVVHKIGLVSTRNHMAHQLLMYMSSLHGFQDMIQSIEIAGYLEVCLHPRL